MKRNISDIKFFINYDLKVEKIVTRSNLHKLKKIEVVNSLYN